MNARPMNAEYASRESLGNGNGNGNGNGSVRMSRRRIRRRISHESPAGSATTYGDTFPAGPKHSLA